MKKIPDESNISKFYSNIGIEKKTFFRYDNNNKLILKFFMQNAENLKEETI